MAVLYLDIVHAKRRVHVPYTAVGKCQPNCCAGGTHDTLNRYRTGWIGYTAVATFLQVRFFET